MNAIENTMVLAQSSDGANKRVRPKYNEVEFTSLGGEIFVNPSYSGKVNSVRTIDRSGLLGEKVQINVRILTDGWRKFTIPASVSNPFGVIISGDKGILKISLPDTPSSATPGDISTVDPLVIEFGSLNSTFVFRNLNVLEPSKYEIGILNNTDNSFINGEILVMKSDQVAAQFQNLPPSVVTKEGKTRVSLKKPDGSFLNSEIPAWGYNVMVPETGVDTPAQITAEVFGLPGDARVRFDFTSLSGQIIDPSRITMTVKDINSGTPVSTITTKIIGTQPLSLTVKRMK